jgi:hypothetical protein
MSDNGENIVIKDFRGEDIAYPKRLLDELTELKGQYNLSDALWFYHVTKNAKSFRWCNASELLSLDTSTYEIHYYESNWEDSQWNMFDRPLRFVQIGEATASDNAQIVIDHGVDEDGDEIEYYGWSLNPSEQVLLVELTDSEVEERIAADLVREQELKRAEDSPESNLLRQLFPEK